jgi:hypothetical protein
VRANARAVLLLPPPARIGPALVLINMADFSDLPHGVLLKIFSGLTPPNPNQNCVRDLCPAASVCPSWREAAKEPGLWRVLDVNKVPLNVRLTGRRLRNLVARSHNTLSWLTLKGCPLVNDAMLALSLQQQPCLVYVSVTGCALVTRHGLAHALCDSEDFQEIVEQLNDPRQSAADAQRCCVATYTLLDAAEDMEATLAHKRLAHWTLCCAVPHCTQRTPDCKPRAAMRCRSTFTLPSAPRLPPTLPSNLSGGRGCTEGASIGQGCAGCRIGSPAQRLLVWPGGDARCSCIAGRHSAHTGCNSRYAWLE